MGQERRGLAFGRGGWCSLISNGDAGGHTAVSTEGLQEQRFKDNGRRADGLLVEFTDIDYVLFDY
ncbi:hypothetical protein ACIO8F_38040 [Streptomyces sp. NPDC087228]|uniref:hypothetical protein n=1 Tax=Streptomyces sp. NPDC087228 TaxID=3365772 RepID=UPI00381D12A4